MKKIIILYFLVISFHSFGQINNPKDKKLLKWTISCDSIVSDTTNAIADTTKEFLSFDVPALLPKETSDKSKDSLKTFKSIDIFKISQFYTPKDSLHKLIDGYQILDTALVTKEYEKEIRSLIKDSANYLNTKLVKFNVFAPNMAIRYYIKDSTQTDTLNILVDMNSKTSIFIHKTKKMRKYINPSSEKFIVFYRKLFPKTKDVLNQREVDSLIKLSEKH